MQTILRASKIQPAGGGTLAARIVLVRQTYGVPLLVTWYQIWPEDPAKAPFFAVGHYFHDLSEVDEVHRDFEKRRDGLGQPEDLDHEETLERVTKIRSGVGGDEEVQRIERAASTIFGSPARVEEIHIPAPPAHWPSADNVVHTTERVPGSSEDIRPIERTSQGGQS